MQHSTGWPVRPASIKRPLYLACVAALVVALAPMSLFAQSADLAAAGNSTLRDGVVVGSDLAFAMNPAGGVEAIDLATGEIRWTSTDALRPLVLAGEMLVAQGPAGRAGVLPILTLDSATGAVRGTAIEVELPEGVWARAKDGLQRRFNAQAYMDRGVVVTWTATRAGKKTPAQGYMPAANEGNAPGQGVAAKAPTGIYENFQGVARVDLATRSAAPVRGLAARTARAQVGLHTGTYIDGAEGRQFLSADGRHVLVSKMVQTESPWNAYRWTLYERGGARLGEVSSSMSAAPFVVRAGRLVVEARPGVVMENGKLVEQPLRLTGIDLTTGSEVWTREITDAEYKGPFAP